MFLGLKESTFTHKLTDNYQAKNMCVSAFHPPLKNIARAGIIGNGGSIWKLFGMDNLVLD